MAKGDPAVSPYVWDAADYQGRIIRVTIAYDGTGKITGITVFRDAACLFTRILVGLGTDGTPDATDKSIPVPAGTTVLGAGQLQTLANKGFGNISVMQTLQITAAP